MPAWFSDHLACAPLGAWLPQWFARAAPLRIDAREHAPPPRLARLLGASAASSTALLHCGASHLPPDGAVAQWVTRAPRAEVVVDLAWVEALAGWYALRPWRREPARRDSAARLAWLLELGLGDPQQWVTTDPLPLVVTLARRRG